MNEKFVEVPKELRNLNANYIRGYGIVMHLYFSKNYTISQIQDVYQKDMNSFELRNRGYEEALDIIRRL